MEIKVVEFRRRARSSEEAWKLYFSLKGLKFSKFERNISTKIKFSSLEKERKKA